MRALLGTIAVLALVGSTGAHAQGVYVEPAPLYVNPAPYPYYAAPPVVVAPAPSAIYVGPGYGWAMAMERPTSTTIAREDGAGLNRTGIDGAGRHSAPIADSGDLDQRAKVLGLKDLG